MNATVSYVPEPGIKPKLFDQDKMGRESTNSAGRDSILQTCPVCGRRLRVMVEYLGTRVCCRHCRGTFTARDGSSSAGDAADEGDSVLQRANRWLALLESF